FNRIQYPLYHIAFSLDGALLASDCRGKDDIRLWDVASGKSLYSRKGGGNGVNQLVFSPDHAKLVSCDPDNTIRFWNRHTGNVVGTFSFPDATALALSPDGARLAVANGKGIGLHLVVPDANRTVAWGMVPPPPKPADFVQETRSSFITGYVQVEA